MSVSYNPLTPRMDNCVLYVDAANPKSWSQNVIPYPKDIFAWSGTAAVNTGTQVRDYTVTDSPVGGIPLKLTSTGTDAYLGTYTASTWNLAPALSGQTWTISFYAKAAVATTGNCFLFSANSSGTYLEAPSSSFSITTSWQRFSFSATFSNASTAFVQCRLGCSVNGGIIWFDGLQVELGSSATTFNPFGNLNRANLNSRDSNAVIGTSYGSVPYSTDGGGCFDFASTTGGVSGSATLGFTFSSNMIPTYGNYTFSAWVKTTSSTGATGLFANSGGGDGYRFGVSTGGIYVLCGLPYAETTVAYLTSFNSAVWHNVVAVYDRQGLETGSPRVATYLDGVYQGALALSSPQIGSTTAVPGIVRSACCGVYTGKLAVFSAYKGHFTSTDVTNNYNALRGRFGL